MIRKGLRVRVHEKCRDRPPRHSGMGTVTDEKANAGRDLFWVEFDGCEEREFAWCWREEFDVVDDEQRTSEAPLTSGARGPLEVMTQGAPVLRSGEARRARPLAVGDLVRHPHGLTGRVLSIGTTEAWVSVEPVQPNEPGEQWWNLGVLTIAPRRERAASLPTLDEQTHSQKDGDARAAARKASLDAVYTSITTGGTPTPKTEEDLPNACAECQWVNGEHNFFCTQPATKAGPSSSPACCDPLSSAPCACRTAGAAQERERIADYVAAHAVLISGHVRKAWIDLAEFIRAGDTLDEPAGQFTRKAGEP